MKKNELYDSCTWESLRKFIMVMKLSVFIILLSVFQLFAGSGLAQQQRITLDFESSRVVDILSHIEKESDYAFLYNVDLVDVERSVSLKLKDAPIDRILSKLFDDSGVKYRIMDNQVIILSARESIQQQKKGEVSGKVKDSSGNPLPGVSIIIKGTTTGTITDFDGRFLLGNVSNDATLVFSFVGMKAQEVAIAGQTSMEIIMEDNAIGLEEVVAIGYGTMRKSDLTGSVANVNVEKLTELPNKISVMEAMQGSIAGLNVGAVNTAGENPSLSIRGQNTLSSDEDANAPLIVLDGIIYRGSIIDLNASDIKSVDILKDASSAAIYGSQASNGVIVITTKNGKLGPPVINYSSSYSIQSPTNSMRPMRNEELKAFFQDVYWDLGSKLAPDYTQDNPDYNAASNLKTLWLVEGYNADRDIDWWDLLTRDASMQSHNLSVTGRTEKTGYFMSVGYTGQEGFNLNDDYSRYNFRVNVDSEITDWLKIGTQTYVVVSDYSGVSLDARQTFRYHPWAPVYDDNGEYVVNPIDAINPFLTYQQDDSDVRLNFSNTLFSEVKLPLKGLSYRLNFSNAYRTENKNNFDPNGNNFTGVGSKKNFINWDYTLDNIISYNNTFDEYHNLAVTLVYGIEKRQFSSTYARATSFGVDILGYNRLQAGDPALHQIITTKEEESSLYQMGRLAYNFKQKYFFTGTIRRDGFSGFGENDKTAIFPSAAFAWTITEESFAENFTLLNYLKARTSYGKSGRRGVDRYQTLAQVDSEPSVAFGDGGAVYQGQAIASLPNAALGWETTTGVDFGLDFHLMNSKIRGSIEYYNNKTENILYNIALPEISGFNSIASNIAEVANNGIELTLEGDIIRNKDFSWNASFNFNRVRNEIVSILGSENDQNNDGVEDDLIASGLFIGEPASSIYNYEIIGMWQLEDEAQGLIPSGFLPGTYKLADLNGDGVISSLDDRKVIGYEDPSYRFGISNNLAYKNLNLSFFINSIQGGNKYYFGKNDDVLHWTSDQLANYNVPSGAWDYWTPSNPDAKYRRLDTSSSFGAQPSNPNGARPYNQRSFVRLQDITLSYTVPKRIIDKIGVKKAKVFLSGKNLATWTKWNGWDPEAGTGFGTGDGFGDFFGPTMKSYSIGLNVEF